MSTALHRATVLVCALAWFLVGLHAPIVHDLTAHHAAPRPSVLVAIALVTAVAVAALWRLLRAPRPRATPATAAPTRR